MNVSEQIIKVLDNLCQKFGIVIDWSAENVLPYLKELCGKFINYEIYTSIAWMILIPVICAIFWIIFISTFKRAKEYDFDPSFFIGFINGVSMLLAIVFSIASIIVVGVQVFDIIEVTYFPEKTIYDFITCHINIHN